MEDTLTLEDAIVITSYSIHYTKLYDFSNHWVMSTREHMDRFAQPVLHARPIAAHMGEPPEFEADPGTNGVALAGALTRFDRAAGYPMAWFFHMLATHAVPYWVAQTVVEDRNNFV